MATIQQEMDKNENFAAVMEVFMANYKQIKGKDFDLTQEVIGPKVVGRDINKGGPTFVANALVQLKTDSAHMLIYTTPFDPDDVDMCLVDAQDELDIKETLYWGREGIQEDADEMISKALHKLYPANIPA